MRRGAARSALAIAGAVCALVVAAAEQDPQRQQPPVFRGAVDVIRLDVSVLDKDRRPVRGLKLEDFTVLENGKPQKIVAVAEVDAAERDPTPTAWMRHVPPDTSTNDLVDQLGDGRLFAIVMDDWNIPWDDLDIIQNAREAGRYVIDGLGPSDIAAVIFPRDAGFTVDFTSDRAKLLSAIDSFDPREPDLFILPRPSAPGGGGGDMPYRWSPALMRSECERSQPTVPTLDVVASRLATVPNRRKTIIFISVGLPLTLAERRGCAADLSYVMREVYRKAQQANINIYGVDPAGYRGYERYLQNPIRRGGRPARYTLPQGAAEGAARTRREFLEITADYTGARAVVGNVNIEAGIDRIFEEDGSYYLVGYQTSNPTPDGKFRKTVVKVNRPDVTVRTRSGYFAPEAGSLVTREQKQAPTPNDLGLTGMSTPTALPLRVSVVPVGLAKEGSKDVDVAVALSVRLPPARETIKETLTIVRNIYYEGKTSQPTQTKYSLTLSPMAGDELRYDVYQHLVLAPGRYEIRLNASSAALSASGTVFADLEVPDFTRAPLVISGVTLGTKVPDANGERSDLLASILPIVPTSARDFAPSDTVTAHFRLFQGSSAAASPVTLKWMVLDIADKTVAEFSQTIEPAAFGSTRSAPVQIDLPLVKMQHGPHLLSITASLPNGTSARKDVVFRVR